MGADTHNPLLDAAKQYAARGWHVFPLSPGSKKPLPGSRGLLDASTDPDQIERWWVAVPQANVAIATGPSGLVVLDPDGEAGAAELQRLVGFHGALARTLVSRTANGFHLVYRGTGVRSTARGDLHVRGEGGYIVAPPSVHPSGHVYAWVDPAGEVAGLAAVVELPGWVRTWREQQGGNPSSGDLGVLGPAPDFLVNLPARDVNFGEPWSIHDESRIRTALAAVPADNYQTWLDVGMALHSLQWDRSDGTSIGLEIWNEFSSKCTEKFSEWTNERRWESFRRSGISIGTLFHLAQKHGWDGRVDYQQNTAIALNGPPETGPFAAANVKPNGHDPTGWVNFDKAGNPTSTCANTRVAIELLGVRCRYDTFHGKYTVLAANGAEHPLQVAGELVDQAVHVIRVAITDRWRFDPTAQHVRDACEQIGIQNRFDPIVDYLSSTEWDHRPRLDTWMTQYLGAADAPLTRAVGVLMLRAAVRRVRQPGCKWDYVVVLEGVENTGKSTALSVLAGDENFSDQSILAHNERDQQEAIQGIWIYELAELAGMRRAEVEKVKAFLTRTNDRARPAYGHYREDRPRRCVFVGTTNTDEYLKSETGNRRFWPIRTGRIDIDRLRADRDQLWAEAVELENRGNGRLELLNGLNEEAAEAQRERLEADPWENPVGAWARGRESVSADDVLRDCLHMQHREQDRAIRARVGSVLKRLGWEKYRHREGLHLTWRFRPPQ